MSPFLSEPAGFLVLDKSAGMTSHDLVDIVRKLYRTKRVGHTGTLDPDATGVMVLCLGKATRLAEYLAASRKRYVTEVQFGVQTSTQDLSGETLASCDASRLTEDNILSLLPQFRGSILQIPPMVSALHHKGKRLYELARQGITVDRAPRPVEVFQFNLIAFTPGTEPVAKFEVLCSTGTYIRTLASDLGDAAGVGAAMKSLRRTWVGGDGVDGFTLEGAVTLDQLRNMSDERNLSDLLIPLTSGLIGWPKLHLTEEQAKEIGFGRAISAALFLGIEQLASPVGGCFALLDGAENLLAIARLEGDLLSPEKVFV